MDGPHGIVPKQNGELWLCVDYRELNKRTVKDAYPLPRPDEAQDRLSGSSIFSTLDLQHGYWQLPVAEEDRPKTAFCPGPGLGLFQFCRMPFGLTGAPSAFQRLMDKVFQGLPFVTTYLDDVLVHSPTVKDHKDHLRQAFQRLANAGLTLRGTKCHIGMEQVSYLGHVFSVRGMEPDPKKVAAVHDWQTPTDASGLRGFLGLASYYRRYINGFADVAAPLHHLLSKGVTFTWDTACQEAFDRLKTALIQAPVLAFPDFNSSAAPFQLQADASGVGVGAVLEQNGHVIAYASRVLSTAERNYSVIQRECLAVVYALKQFRHYLLGRHFIVLTDHAPLQWLSAQKMEGMLACWALVMQEFTFTIQYRRGKDNNNADSLSRQPQFLLDNAAAVSWSDRDSLREGQQRDPVIAEIRTRLQTSSSCPTPSIWSGPPLSRYRQLWTQLSVVDGIVSRTYRPGPSSVSVNVPLVPVSLQRDFLRQSHDSPQAGHLGADKSASRLRQMGYWVGMLQDVERYCQSCVKCQESKPPMPTKVPLTNIPIGQPWEMVAVDILQLPLSSQHNKYLLVVQDYFTKWAEAVPLPDQTAESITRELVSIFSHFGLPNILHSDQGANFESTMLNRTLEAFGIRKSRPTPYHPQGDGMVERLNCTLLQMLRAYVSKSSEWELHLPLVLFAYRSAVHPSTGFSPFELMFGRNATQADLPQVTAFEPSSYQAALRNRLAEFRDLVETHYADAAHKQKLQYDHGARPRHFAVGDSVWLSCPTARKLDLRWEGGWTISKLRENNTLEIANGKSTKVVHVNRIRNRVQPGPCNSTVSQDMQPTPWQPPSITHDTIMCDEPTRRYPQRIRGPPDRLQMSDT